jgi:hypothetical protein
LNEWALISTTLSCAFDRADGGLMIEGEAWSPAWP